MNDGLSDKERDGIQSVLKSCSKIEKVILFGSRAMGTFRAASDIDLALEGDALTLADLLQLKSNIAELNLPVDVDLILINSIQNEELKDHIQKYGSIFKLPTPTNKKDWTPQRLGDIAKLTPGFAFKSNDFTSSGEKVIKIKDITPPFINCDNLPFVNTSLYPKNKLKKYTVSEGDFVFAMTGATIGKIAKITNGSAYVNQRVCKFENKHGIDKKFLYYLITSKTFYQYVISHIDSESAQANIGHPTLSNFTFLAPSLLEEQQKIAAILSSLDDKIELNNKINANLEAQAQALFKSWFVDFEPFQDGEFVDSELGRIPKGWRVGTLSELIEIKYGKDHKKLLDGKIPVYGSGGVMRFVDKFLYDKESILIPRKGSLNNVTYINEPFWSVDTMFFSIIKKQYTAKYIYLSLKRRDLASMNSGSAVPSMTADILNKLPIVIPTDLVLEKFENISNSIFSTIQHNLSENKILSNILGLLLPKLMSGEIRI